MTRPVGFWGLVVEPGKIYSQKVPEAFRITMATLGPVSASEAAAAKRCVLMLTHHKDGEFALCALTPGAHEQQQLDLVFNEGEMIHIRVEGALPVHLTGNYVEMDAPDAMDYDDEDDSEACSEDALSCSDASDCCSDEACSDVNCVDHSDADTGDSDVDTEDDSDIETEDDSEIDSEGSDVDSDEVELDSEDESIDSDEVEPRIVEIKESEPEAKKAKTAAPAGMVACASGDKSASCSGTSTPASMATPDAKGAASSDKAAKGPRAMSFVDIKQGAASGMKAQKGRIVDVTLAPAADVAGKAQAGKAQTLSFNLNDAEVLGSLREAVRGMAVGGERRVTLPAATLKAAGQSKKNPDFGGMCAPDGSAHFVVRLDKVQNAK